MIPPTFQIGDKVEVIDPSSSNFREKFRINMIREGCGNLVYQGDADGSYIASSLRLVEPELKVGDYAEVILPDNPFTGKIGQVSSIGELTVALCDMGIWSRGNLRKLTPEEIAEHMNPGKSMYEYPTTPAKDFDELTLRDVARMSGICKNEYGVWISTLFGRVHKNDERLSAIEKCQHESSLDIDNHRLSHEKWRDRVLAIEKRLDFVEQFRRDQTRDALYKGWRAGP